MTDPVGDGPAGAEGPVAPDSTSSAVDLTKNESTPSTAVSESESTEVAAGPTQDRRWWQRGRQGDAPKGKRPLSHEIPVLIVIALVLALLIKSFIVQPFYIPSGSMERTLLINDRVLVNKMIYHFRDVKRGEIVVFNIEGTGFESHATPLSEPGNIASRAFRNVENLFGLGPNNKDFIKRVIAIGGDTVACCNAKNQVTVNGVGLTEPYVYLDGPEINPTRQFGPIKVAKDNLWVMGDHRNNSDDSRIGGQVPQSKVIGQAFVRVWPLSHWRGFGIPKTFSQLDGSSAPAIGVVLPLLWWRRRGFRLPALTAPRASPEE